MPNLQQGLYQYMVLMGMREQYVVNSPREICISEAYEPAGLGVWNDRIREYCDLSRFQQHRCVAEIPNAQFTCGRRGR